MNTTEMTPVSHGLAAALGWVTQRGPKPISLPLTTFQPTVPTSARVIPLKYKSHYNPLLKEGQWLPIVLMCWVLSHFSCVQLCTTPKTVALQAPLSMGFSRQEYWSELPCPPPGDPPNLGIGPVSLMSPVLADRFFTTSASCEAQTSCQGFQGMG